MAVSEFERQRMWSTDAQRLRNLGGFVQIFGIALGLLMMIVDAIVLFAAGIDNLSMVLYVISILILKGWLLIIFALVIQAIMAGIASVVEIAWFNMQKDMVPGKEEDA